jgi:hypothetical protein
MERGTCEVFVSVKMWMFSVQMLTKLALSYALFLTTEASDMLRPAIVGKVVPY